FLFVAVPVFAPDPIGYLIGGSAVDDRTAADLRRLTGSHITFGTAKEVLASSWPPEQRRELFPTGGFGEDVLRHDERGTFLMPLGNERLLSLMLLIDSRLASPLVALVQQSYDEALEPLHALRRRVLAIGAAALGAALGVGALLAAGLAA